MLTYYFEILKEFDWLTSLANPVVMITYNKTEMREEVQGVHPGTLPGILLVT